MSGGIYDLSGKQLKDTYDRITQYESTSSALLNGRGELLREVVISGSLGVTGTLTANRLIVSTSIIEYSGSTKWGDTADDTHQFTGSVQISGSLTLNTASIDEGLTDFIVWDSGSGEFKRRTSGADGTSGTAGSGGSSGTAGSGGADGTSGTAGSGGSSGTAGSGGADGTSGTAGSGGADGTSGTAGSGGSSGTAGSGGADGTSGTAGSGGADGTSGTSAATLIWADSGSYTPTNFDVQITGSINVSGTGSFSHIDAADASNTNIILLQSTNDLTCSLFIVGGLIISSSYVA